MHIDEVDAFKRVGDNSAIYLCRVLYLESILYPEWVPLSTQNFSYCHRVHGSYVSIECQQCVDPFGYKHTRCRKPTSISLTNAADQKPTNFKATSRTIKVHPCVCHRMRFFVDWMHHILSWTYVNIYTSSRKWKFDSCWFFGELYIWLLVISWVRCRNIVVVLLWPLILVQFMRYDMCV